MNASLTPLSDMIAKKGHSEVMIVSYYLEKLRRPGFDPVSIFLKEMEQFNTIFTSAGGSKVIEILPTPRVRKIMTLPADKMSPEWLDRITYFEVKYPLFQGKSYGDYFDSPNNALLNAYILEAFKVTELLANQVMPPKNKNNKNKRNNKPMTRKQLRQSWYNLANQAK